VPYLRRLVAGVLVSIPGRVMWRLWWTKWYCGAFFSSTSVCPASSHFINCCIFINQVIDARSRDGVVGIATGYQLDDRGVGVGVPIGSSSSRALEPTQPPIQWVLGILSPAVRRPGRDAHHSPPTSAEVKKTWSYTSTPPPIRLHGVVLNWLITGTALP
jgi:hypothetical protein